MALRRAAAVHAAQLLLLLSPRKCDPPPDFNCGSPVQVEQALEQADAAILHFQDGIPLSGL